MKSNEKEEFYSDRAKIFLSNSPSTPGRWRREAERRDFDAELFRVARNSRRELIAVAVSAYLCDC